MVEGLELVQARDVGLEEHDALEVGAARRRGVPHAVLLVRREDHPWSQRVAQAPQQRVPAPHVPVPPERDVHADAVPAPPGARAHLAKRETDLPGVLRWHPPLLDQLLAVREQVRAQRGRARRRRRGLPAQRHHGLAAHLAGLAGGPGPPGLPAKKSLPGGPRSLGPRSLGARVSPRVEQHVTQFVSFPQCGVVFELSFVSTVVDRDIQVQVALLVLAHPDDVAR